MLNAEYILLRRAWCSALDERASNAAMVAAALIGAITLFASTLGSAVDTQYRCLHGVLSGSGAGCDGGDGSTAAEPAPAQDSDDGGGWNWGGIPDGVQVVLDVAGLVPGFGTSKTTPT